MKIAVFGANGKIGDQIVKEALHRGHHVTAIVRDPARIQRSDPHLIVVAGNVLDAGSVAELVAGQDAVVSAVGPSGAADSEIVVHAAQSLIDGLARAGVGRLIVVNGAGSLEVAPGVKLVDTAEFPAAWRPIALAHAEALEEYRNADLDWTVFSPAALIEPGEHTGKYRTGTEHLVTDDAGNSRISTEDYAGALLDELENPKFLRKRFTAAY